MNVFHCQFLTVLCLLCTASVFAQQTADVEPYAVTANKVTLTKPTTIQMDPQSVTVLSPNLGTLSSGVRPTVMNYMILWAQVAAGSNQVIWAVNAPAAGRYQVAASLKGGGSQLAVSCQGHRVQATVTASDWHRLPLGEIPLQAGLNKVLLEMDVGRLKDGQRTGSLQFGALELTRPAVHDAIQKEALAMRQQPAWFKDAGYGLMFQWTNRATPPTGPIKAWQQKVDDFDLDGFVKLVEESGAAYVVWSITWGNQYISAPNKALDAIIVGRTTRRDLLGEMTDRLHANGVKVIFYYHYGYDCYHSQDPEWLEAAGGTDADKSKLYTNVMNILSEVGERCGDKLDGWWFDGGARFLNCHFDGSSGADGILSAPFKAFTAAARVGNPERMVAYNSWIKPRITEYQDYYGGEGKTSFKSADLSDGVFIRGRQKGLQAHGCFPFERRWGHIDLNRPIAKPKFDAKKLTSLVRQAQQRRYPLSINLEMYEDGSVSPASAAVLKQLKAAVRSN